MIGHCRGRPRRGGHVGLVGHVQGQVGRQRGGGVEVLLCDVDVGADKDLKEHVLQKRTVGETLKLFAIT